MHQFILYIISFASYLRRSCFVWAVLLLQLGFADDSSAQYSARAYLDSASVIIGKEVNLTLQLKKPERKKIQWPVIPQYLGQVEVLSRGTVDTVSSEGGIQTLQQVIKLTAFDSGFFVIPPISFFSGKPNDTTTLASTAPVSLSVHIMTVDTTAGFKDIKGIRAVPFDWKVYIWYIVTGIAVILLILIGRYIYDRIKKKEKMPALFNKESGIPPHEKALNALRDLDNGRHWQNGEVKFYHSRLSDIIRLYIEERWMMPAMEQTTDEILESAFVYQQDNEVKQKLTNVLRIADLAKFAKFQPLPDENEQSMQEAVEFITLTIPVPVEEKKAQTA
jgi:hypothetical protein